MPERTAKLGPGDIALESSVLTAYLGPSFSQGRILDNRSRGRWLRRIVCFVNGSIDRGTARRASGTAGAALIHAELDISWQLQRVRGQLLHRATKTEASDATLLLPGICVTPCECSINIAYADRDMHGSGVNLLLTMDFRTCSRASSRVIMFLCRPRVPCTCCISSIRITAQCSTMLDSPPVTWISA